MLASTCLYSLYAWFEIVNTAAQISEKSHLKDLQSVNDIEVYSSSSEIALFNSTSLSIRLVISINTASILPRFWDITPSTVYETDSDLDKSFSFSSKVERWK